MILIEVVLGQCEANPWPERLSGLSLDVLELDHWEAQKGRLRKHSRAGREIAVSLPRHSHLQNGDVLHVDQQAGWALVVELRLREVLRITLADLDQRTPQQILATAFEVGHALGNQHWPAVVRGDSIYMPLAVARSWAESVMQARAFEHVHYEFLDAEEVIPFLAPHELRRLQASAEAG